MSDSRNKSPEEIQADIEATREAMRADVDAIGNQVSPTNLKEQAQGVVSDVKDSVIETLQGVSGQVGSQAGEWGSKAVAVVKANPLPTALVGVGLAWLLMRSGEDEKPAPHITAYSQPLPTASFGYETAPAVNYDSSREEASGPSLREKAGQLGSQASTKVDDVREGIVQGAQQTKRGFERLLDENPLVLTSVALVLGATVSMLLPSTKQEDELMGGARDQLMDKARETATAVKEVAQETAQKVGETVKDEVGKQGLTPETARDNVQGLMDKAKGVASEALDTAKETAQQKADEKGLTSS